MRAQRNVKSDFASSHFVWQLLKATICRVYLWDVVKITLKLLFVVSIYKIKVTLTTLSIVLLKQWPFGMNFRACDFMLGVNSSFPLHFRNPYAMFRVSCILSFSFSVPEILGWKILAKESKPYSHMVQAIIQSIFW